MKKLFFIAAVTFSVSASAQLQTIETSKETTVGRIKMGGVLRYDLSYTVSDTDTTYRFTYPDSRYKVLDEYKTLKFDGAANTLQNFYDILKTFFIDENRNNKDYVKQFMLGKSLVTAKAMKSGFGIKAVFLLIDNSEIILSEKEIEKIFGKK